MPGDLTLSQRDSPGQPLPPRLPSAAWYRSASCAAAPLTVTVKLADTGELMSSASVAVQETVVVPIPNTLPDFGVHTAAGALASSGSVTASARRVA